MSFSIELHENYIFKKLIIKTTFQFKKTTRPASKGHLNGWLQKKDPPPTFRREAIPKTNC
jgi:hypothetical protein